MASITLKGTLLDPNGDLAVGDQIRFTHKSTAGNTVEGAVSILTINPAGTYSFPLQYGLVLVEYKDVRTQQFKNLGVATVNSTNPATSIPELLNALVPASSAELIEFQDILANCVTSQTAAENAATTAEAFAYQLTTTELIASTAIFTAATSIPTSGFTTSGDGGNGSWKQNGVTGQTPSQTPAQLGDVLLNDGNGNQWGLVSDITVAAVGGDYLAGDKAYTVDSSFVSTQTINLAFGIDGNDSLTWADAFNSGLVTVTTPFFSNSGTPTHKRQSGRMFVGEAASRFAGDAGIGDGGNSWLSSDTDSPSYLAVNSHLLVTNDSGNYAAAFGARSLNNTGAGVIAVGSAIKNDKAGGRGWGFIAELQHEQGASVTNGIEVAAKNKSTDNFTYSPYTASFGVFGARLAAGGDDLFGGIATNPSTAAIIIIKNAETWNTGIVFASDAITGTDGSAISTTSANAITLARRHLIRWNSPEGANTYGAGIVSTVTETTKSTTQQFIDNGANFVNSSGQQIVRFNGGATTVNFLQVDAASTGAPVKISAQGSDANINLRLDAKGGGLVQFGTHVVQGDLPTNGYITILDSSGNSRRIATV